MAVKYSKDLIKELGEAIEQKQDSWIINYFEDWHAADISSVLYKMDTEESKYVLGVLDAETGADIIRNLDEDTRTSFLKVFNSEELTAFIEHTDSDDAADILNEQPVKVREEVIALLDDVEKANYIVDLLHYEEDCAGGLMAKELIKANINWNIKQCIEEIRRQTEKVEKILTVYVVDNNDILLGRVSLKKMILSKDDTKVKDIYIPEVETVQTYFDEEEVADLMQKYDLEVIPVINVQGKLLGRITIDDIVDVITEQAELEQQMMSGISENIEADDSVWTLSRARLPWLIIGMMGGLLGAQFIGFFEKDLTMIPAMAFFIPLITATGGNVGIQSSTIIVQSLANNSVLKDSALKRLVKIFTVAIINGITISAIVFGFNAFFADLNLAIVVSFALFCVVLLASFMGTITPLLLDRVNINPALASGPFITTANDLLGLAVYFMIARLLYNL